MKIRTLGATAVLVLTLGACGGGDDDEASKAIADSIMDSNSDTFEVTQDQADCVGDGLVDEIGTDQIVEYGILTEDNKAADGIEQVEMSDDDAESAADVMQECADIKEIFTSAMGELPEEAQTCIDEQAHRRRAPRLPGRGLQERPGGRHPEPDDRPHRVHGGRRLSRSTL